MVKKIQSALHHEATGGFLLAGAALIALLFANLPIHYLYQNFLEIPVTVQLGEFIIAKPLLLWINDGLMALFFLYVGLEIKREILEGNLSSKEQIILPAIAAVAGIAFPALIYAYINKENPIALNGWAIPSATDIAFAIGIFAIFGSRLPISLKLFLLSVAIFDDIGAIVIIAIFYSQDISTLSLVISAAGLCGLFALNRYKVSYLTPYILIGTVVWAAVLKSGVHATLAGFLIAWFIPLNVKNQHGERMAPSVEKSLHSWVAFFILPLFAFANAGVMLLGVSSDVFLNSVTVGIAAGLFFGKQVGIFGVCWLAIKLRFAKLPKDATWSQLYGVCALAGIGFTMSLFIGSLAFEVQGTEFSDNVKIGVIIGSIMSAIVGAVLLARSQKKVTMKHEVINTSTDKNLAYS